VKKDFLVPVVVKSESSELEGSRGVPSMVHFLTSEAKGGVDSAERGGDTKDGNVRVNGGHKLGLGLRFGTGH
jgi:hypothetical protein